jgi:peptidoglycan/xylan/chitin deacetylase (PgdA/CDA1 family)
MSITSAKHNAFNYKNMTMWAICLILLMNLFNYLVNENFGYAVDNNSLTRDTNEANSVNSKCKCIVFRLDDIQDYWLNSVQSAVMDLFMSKGQNLSLGLIMHIVGNDSKIVDKIKTGLGKGLFELDAHGWDHINYTKLIQNKQKQSLYNASMKMEKMFGTNPAVFIPPFDTFNNDTISAMKKLGMNIISSGLPEESRFDQNRSIFIANHPGINNRDILSERLLDNEKNNDTNNKTASVVYHLPATIFFKDFQNGKWVKTPVDDILSNSSRNIAKYGYAIVVLHPQDFANTTYGTAVPTNSVNKAEITDLARLIDNFLSRNLKIMPFHKVITFSS